MFKGLRPFSAIVLFSGLASSHITQANTWPYPQDTPTPQAVSVGLAGDMPVDITRFLLAHGASQVKVNQQGTQVAFVSRVTGSPQLWVQPIEGGQATQLTFGNGITFYQWHPDGEHLLYGADNDGNEREAFYLISGNGEQEQLVLPHSQAFRQFGRFSPDGKKFTFASTERNGRDFDIYVHDFASGKSHMLWEAQFGYYPSAWQPSSQTMVITEVRGEDASDVYLLNAHTREMRPLFKPQVAAEFKNIQWSQDGKWLYYSSNDDREMMALMRMDAKTHNVTLLRESRYDLENLHLCDHDSVMAWTENNQGFDTLWLMDMASQQVQKVALEAGVYNISCAANASAMTVNVSGPSTPGDIYTVDTHTGTTQKLRAASLAGIQKQELVTPEPISFPAQDGVMLYGLLYLPQGEVTQAPLVVDVHGGPTAQARPSWQALTQYLVGKGIAVLDINVRGSTGYGKTFMRLDNQTNRLNSVRDLTDALTYLKDDPRINASKAAVMGGSYGGYMVNAVMGLYPGKFAAGASFVGVSDWVRALQTASPGLKASDRIEYGDIRESHWQAFYADNSPINTVHNIASPMFYEHGVNDPRDPVTESDRMVRVLREKRIPVTYLRFPDEGHSVSKLANRVVFYRELAAFLERHLTTTK